MLSRFVRIQLAIFTIVGTIGVIAMVLFYIQAPTLLGIGRMTVTLELPATGGLYRFSNVTYRGVQLGKVTSVELTPTGAKATLSLSTSPKVPADLRACPERPGPMISAVRMCSVSPRWVNSTWTCGPEPIRRPTCTTAR